MATNSGPLPTWPDLDHTVPAQVVRCRRCAQVQPVTHYCPSQLRERHMTTRRGMPTIAPASRLCRQCIRRAHRHYYGHHPQRRYAHEAEA